MTDSPNAGGPMPRSPSRATGPPGESVGRMVHANEVGLCAQAFGHAGDPVILLTWPLTDCPVWGGVSPACGGLRGQDRLSGPGGG
jgi:hypothetical protein